MEDVGEYRNWAELPAELTSSILYRLGPIEILENAQKVCMSWRAVSKDPLLWRKIDMHDFEKSSTIKYDVLCRHAVDRSQGGLVAIDLWNLGSDELINYIADRSSNLRTLRFEETFWMTYKGYVETFMKLPLLEHLEVQVTSCTQLSGGSLKVAGQFCPNLKTLKLTFPPNLTVDFDEYDSEAQAIAESMPKLSYLQLFGYELTNEGLSAILDGCPCLEHLDIRRCSNLNLVGDLDKRCSERIKDLRRPDDSIADHPLAFLYDASSIEEEYDHSYDSEDTDYLYRCLRSGMYD